MKNFILLLLLPLLSFGQFQDNNYLYLSTEIDPRNAIFGSDVNEPAYDGVFNIGYRNESFTIQATYETFSEIKFQSIAIRGGIVLNHEGDFKYTGLLGVGFIFRDVTWTKAMSCSLDLSGQLEYHFENFFLLARAEGRYRGDLQEVIPSGYVGIGIKLF